MDSSSQNLNKDVANTASSDLTKADVVSTEKEVSTDSVIPDEVARLLPRGARQSMEMMMQMSGPMPNPVSKKITAEHISRIIEVTAESEARQFTDGQAARKWTFAFYAFGIVAFLFLVVFLADKNKDLLLELLKLFITFVGGMGAGWGIKCYRNKESD